LEISFRDRRIQKLCSIEKESTKRLGQRCARKLRARMMDLSAAQSLEDLRNVPGTGRLHELRGDRKGQFAMDLVHPLRLVLIPTEDPPPKKNDGGLDWNQITAVTIIEIGDYH
jgi:toxin HigB-1